MTAASAFCKQCGKSCHECGSGGDTYKGELFCNSCWRSRCNLCENWESGMQRCGLSWQCLSCHTLTPTEKSCFKAMNAVLARPPFRVWDQGRREDSTGQMEDRRADLNQPAVLTPWLMIGDLGDVIFYPAVMRAPFAA